ncbi:MAG TPA: aminotransferase class I/II-fold pyridoxal phosphate-dependent enzyme [Steroidobacteraceae bacterium]|nr:aminotransferase class I/II-fold pyridoxal phosphate-dependent enzyme [Steroidobacteraceae bacterium]
MAGRLDTDSLLLLHDALARLEQGFAALPPIDTAPGDPAALREVLNQVAERLRDNYPYFHPQYAGQMLKPPHAIARLAYALAMWINPNNHALDGGRASSAMEKEAVADIARMFGWGTHLGHLTSGGTMANLEALWIAGELKPGAAVVASAQAHYTHGRISAVLKLPFESIPADARGRMDVRALERRLAAGGVGTVVATLGTTATGSVDPLPEILALRDRYGFRLHADCAYGGYFGLADNLAPPARAAFDLLGEADSIVIDPHKHGLQPYGCGCVLFRDPAVGRHYRHDSPYTYFSSDELHLGEISLECSRPGAAAVALWATQKLFPLVRDGEFAKRLADCRAAALELHAFTARDRRFIPAFEPELDIVVWAVRAGSAAESSERARAVFGKAADAGLHLALAELPVDFFGNPWQSGGAVTALRSVLMKPEHLAQFPAIRRLLDEGAS